ncbi:MAG: 8-amino-7-oxononanoate synthase [Tepidisphaeraceae bacterium]
MPESFDSLLKEELSRLAEARQLRSRRVVVPIDAVHVEIDGRVCVNFCSNNYLGLTHHRRVVAAVGNAAAKFGAGAGAAGLISGFSTQHAAAESAIASWKGTEAAILLPSGYQANHAAIQTLAALGKNRGGVRFLVDKLAHVSLLDALRGSGAAWRVFPHNGMSKLKRLLDQAEAEQLQVVVTESIFSMDGDAADLKSLDQLKRARPFVLLLDEAHASGVYGPGGAGLAAEWGLAGAVDISVATFSKAAGCAGGAICARGDFCRTAVNLGRAYIFSTSIPPAIAAGIEEAIRAMHDEPQRQQRVRALARELRERLRGKGMVLPDGDSPIVPIIVGEESAALELAGKLLEKNLLVGAIRPPTVPRGTSRLRVTLSCEHTQEEIDRLIDTVAGESSRG